MENIEQVKSDEGGELPPIKLTNLIQYELIKESHEDSVVWVAQNSENFRKLLEANPNLLEDYEKSKSDKDKKEAFLKFVAGALTDIREGEGDVN
jgi:hypothetical protein